MCVACMSMCVCLSLPQSELYKVFHSILRCPETRTAAVDFFQDIIRLNSKKARLHVDTRRYSADGFMLNVLSVMHQLCLRIKLKKVYTCRWYCWVAVTTLPRPQVDALYLVRPESHSRLTIQQETRLCYTAKQLEEKQKELGGWPQGGEGQLLQWPSGCSM